jgi:hypothetical protein
VRAFLLRIEFLQCEQCKGAGPAHIFRRPDGCILTCTEKRRIGEFPGEIFSGLLGNLPAFLMLFPGYEAGFQALSSPQQGLINTTQLIINFLLHSAGV